MDKMSSNCIFERPEIEVGGFHCAYSGDLISMTKSALWNINNTGLNCQSISQQNAFFSNLLLSDQVPAFHDIFTEVHLSRSTWEKNVN